MSKSNLTGYSPELLVIVVFFKHAFNILSFILDSFFFKCSGIAGFNFTITHTATLWNNMTINKIVAFYLLVMKICSWFYNMMIGYILGVDLIIRDYSLGKWLSFICVVSKWLLLES